MIPTDRCRRCDLPYAIPFRFGLYTEATDWIVTHPIQFHHFELSPEAHPIRITKEQAARFRAARFFVRAVIAAGFMRNNPGMTAEQALAKLDSIFGEE